MSFLKKSTAIIGGLVVSSFVHAQSQCEKIDGCCIVKKSGQPRYSLNVPDDVAPLLASEEILGSIHNPITLLTGAKNSTYYSMAQDIKVLMQCSGIALKVKTSDGSKENLEKIPMNSEDAKLAITQSDILQDLWVKSGGNLPIRTVGDLHFEQIHVIAKEDIKSWDDLAGRKVFVGELGSGTKFTADKLLELKKLTDPVIRVTDSTDYITDLQNGKYDAMFYVVGAPTADVTSIFEELPNLNLVSIASDSDSFKSYSVREIPAGTYPYINYDVKTYSIDATLITYVWESGKSDYLNRLCDITKTVYDSLNSSVRVLGDLATPSKNESGSTWATHNWIDVELHRTAGLGGITPRSECIN